LLRWFGAQVGQNVIIRSKVRVHWPWKLSIGDDCWIGEGAWLLNLEPIVIENDVCISQEALLCTGSHEHKSQTFDFKNSAIRIGDGAWIAARATILPGVAVGTCSVVASGTVLRKDLPPLTMALGDERIAIPEPT